MKKKPTKCSAGGNKAVGYRKPPKASRFKPGKSGNPLGRPLGSRNRLPSFGSEAFKSVVLTEIYRDTEVVEGKKKSIMPAITAIAQNLVGKAVDHRVAQMLFQIVIDAEREQKEEYERFVRHAKVYMELWSEEIDSAIRAGRQPPEPDPHPSQFVIDSHTGILTIRGAGAEAGTENSEDDLPMYSQAVARWFRIVMKLPPGKDIRYYIVD